MECTIWIAVASADYIAVQAIFHCEADESFPIMSRYTSLIRASSCGKPQNTVWNPIYFSDSVMHQSIFRVEVDEFFPIEFRDAAICPEPHLPRTKNAPYGVLCGSEDAVKKAECFDKLAKM
jgi:hypothetical protein